MIKNWAKSQEEVKTGETDELICQSPEITTLILKSMNELATANKFNGLERVKKLYLHPEAFTEQNGLMTPSQKLKRNVSAQVFRSQINKMYGI